MIISSDIPKNIIRLSAAYSVYVLVFLGTEHYFYLQEMFG